MTATRSSRRLYLGLAVLVALLAGAVVGVTVRSKSAEPTTPKPTSTPVSVGDLRLNVPLDWQAAPRIFKLPGLDGPLSISLQTSEGFAVIAQAPPGDDSLLPAALTAELGHPTAKPAVLDAPGGRHVNALHYTYLSTPSIGAPMDVYVVPTTHDAAVLACIGGGANCSSALAGLRLTSGRILQPGPDAGLLSRLDGIITPLATARRTARDQLGKATTPADRAAAATTIADAYRTALGGLGHLSASPQAITLRRLLRRLWRDHVALATAATNQDTATFSTMAGDITAAERALDRLLGRWQSAPAS